jgi:pilus assembly protein CpaF
MDKSWRKMHSSVFDKGRFQQDISLTDRQQEDGFRQRVEDVRSELVNGRGATEEERQQYSDKLNRAVLGFPKERRELLAMIQDILAKRRIIEYLPENRHYGTMAEAIFAEIIGLSVLELILQKEDGLEEIQVVGTRIFEVRGGISRPSLYELNAVSDLERIQQNLVLFNNESLGPRQKWAEVRLHDGSRVTMTGFGFTAEPTLTIRFYRVKHHRLEQLTSPEYATINRTAKDLLHCFIHSYFNLVVIGATNSGKTHLIKAMIAETDDNERLITIESRLELMLKRDFPHKNIIEYETDEDDGRHNGQQAFKLALRQSPKRICHAEIRDEDANIYVRACTRGHQGSMTTVHASRLEDVPDAIADMCMMDGRGMDPQRLTKRITEYVTQIGLEMAVVGQHRKLVRIGEFRFVNGEPVVNELMTYDSSNEQWVRTGQLTNRSSEQILKFDSIGYENLVKEGFIAQRLDKRT